MTPTRPRESSRRRFGGDLAAVAAAEIEVGVQRRALGGVEAVGGPGRLVIHQFARGTDAEERVPRHALEREAPVAGESWAVFASLRKISAPAQTLAAGLANAQRFTGADRRAFAPAGAAKLQVPQPQAHAAP